jgi:hypothetical protein
MRGAILRLYLDPAVTPSAALRAEMRAALPEGAAPRVERAGAAEWLPVTWELAMLRAVHAAGGDRAVRELSASLARSARATPVFRTLYAAMLGVVGRSREAMVRVAIAAWDLGMRNAGRRGAIEGDGRVFRVVHEDLPAAWDRLLVLRVCGSAEVMLEWNGVAPRADAEWSDGATRAVYVLTWPEAGATR